MHKSWQVLYQCRASIQTSKVLLSLGFFNKPNIFASAKYFFLWPFQVYYRRRGGTLSRFPLESCRDVSLSLERPSSDISMWKLFPVGGCRPPALPTTGTSHHWPATPGQQPEPAMAPTGIGNCLQWIFLSTQRSKAVSQNCKTRGVLSGLLQHRSSSGRGWDLRGLLRWGKGCRKPDPSLPSLIHTGAATALRAPSPCCLFLSLS